MTTPKPKRLPRRLRCIHWWRASQHRYDARYEGWQEGYAAGLHDARTPTVEELAGMEADYRSRSRGF